MDAKRLWVAAPKQWREVEPTEAELFAAEKEAMEGAAFDRANLKRGVFEAWKAGRARLVCRELPGLARVVAFLPAGAGEPDWDVWRRVFGWFGAPRGGGLWPVTWFAAAAKRQSPGIGQDLGPEHVNGGYTVPCSTKGITIYRAEEATRVLIHELMHAACLDETSWDIPMREAMVETWAELILVAIAARGRPAAAERLWAAQAQWVADTNWRAEHLQNADDPGDYAWRYLGGRAQMYARLGVTLPAPRPAVAAKQTSLRFTHPSLEI